MPKHCTGEVESLPSAVQVPKSGSPGFGILTRVVRSKRHSGAAPPRPGYFQSLSICRAAFRPESPVPAPPGWVPGPQR